MKHLSTLAFALASTFLANAQLTNGLIAYYPFNSGNTENQAPTTFSTLFAQSTAPTANALGVPNQALAFSGSAPQLWVSSDGLIDFGTTTSFSFITDFKSGSSAEQNFFRDLLDNGHGWHIGFYNSSGYVTFETGTGANAISLHTTGIYNDLAWHQVALLVDKINLTVRIFVDNELQELAGSVCGSAITGTIADISACNFNANEDNDQLTSFGEDLIGSLDQIRLYGRLLTEAEVAEAFVLSFGTTSVRALPTTTIVDLLDRQTNTLTLSGLGTSACDLTVIDNQGRVLKSERTAQDRVRIDLSALTTGIYIVRASQHTGSWTKRIVLVD